MARDIGSVGNSNSLVLLVFIIPRLSVTLLSSNRILLSDSVSNT